MHVLCVVSLQFSLLWGKGGGFVGFFWEGAESIQYFTHLLYTCTTSVRAKFNAELCMKNKMFNNIMY